jgi:hypothetical protein
MNELIEGARRTGGREDHAGDGENQPGAEVHCIVQRRSIFSRGKLSAQRAAEGWIVADARGRARAFRDPGLPSMPKTAKKRRWAPLRPGHGKHAMRVLEGGIFDRRNGNFQPALAEAVHLAVHIEREHQPV